MSHRCVLVFDRYCKPVNRATSGPLVSGWQGQPSKTKLCSEIGGLIDSMPEFEFHVRVAFFNTIHPLVLMIDLTRPGQQRASYVEWINKQTILSHWHADDNKLFRVAHCTYTRPVRTYLVQGTSDIIMCVSRKGTANLTKLTRLG